MKKVLKRSACLLTAVALSATMVALPAAAEEAHAAEKPHMKTLKLKWDLKKNKAVTSKEKIATVGNKAVKITVKNCKTVKLKNGKKKTTLTIEYKRSYSKLTKKQVSRIQGTDYEGGGFADGPYYALVDYGTGKSLEGNSATAKKLGVKVKASKWTHAKGKKVKISTGYWISLAPKSTAKVTVTYPSDYKGLCLGVWANNFLEDDLSHSSYLAHERFWDGKKPFGKTTYYKKGKTNSHWMRIK